MTPPLASSYQVKNARVIWELNQVTRPGLVRGLGKIKNLLQALLDRYKNIHFHLIRIITLMA